VVAKTLSDDVDTMQDNQRIVGPEQDQKLCEHTPWPQCRMTASSQYTPQPRP
jgi:hypothetical protein